MENAKKRSRQMAAPLVSALAALMALNGCGGQRTATGRCVDASGNVLPDSACRGSGGGYAGGGGYYGGSRYVYPHWVYGGRVSGGRVSGYSATAPEGARVVSPSGLVVRGGFGSHGFGMHGFGGGHGFGG